MVKEKRKFRRVKEDVKVTYKVMGKKGEYDLPALEISGGGLRLLLKEKLAPGTLLELGLNLPGDPETLFVLAKVAWQSEAPSSVGESGKPKAYDSGIQFVKAGVINRRKIVKYVYEGLGKPR